MWVHFLEGWLMWKGPSRCGYDSPGKVAPGYIRKQSERVWGASLSKQCSSMWIKGDDSCLGDFWVCSLAQTKKLNGQESQKTKLLGEKKKEKLRTFWMWGSYVKFYLTTKWLAREAPEPLVNTSSWRSYLLPIRSGWENPTADTQLDARYRSVKQELSWKLPPLG